MKFLYAAATISAIGNCAYAYDGAWNSEMTGWAVAAVMFIAALGREMQDA